VVDERQDTEVEAVAVVVPSEPAPLTPRQRAARRRHRRRVIGSLLFVAVAIGVFAAAYFSFVDSSDSSDDASSTSTSLPTTTTTPKANGPYQVITGVNIRQGPATTSPSVGTLKTGEVVFVACVVDGEAVDGPTGPSTKWLKLTGFVTGYLTVQYVDLGADLTTPGKIPACPSA
jgi:hypothetical protein